MPRLTPEQIKAARIIRRHATRIHKQLEKMHRELDPIVDLAGDFGFQNACENLGYAMGKIGSAISAVSLESDYGISQEN